jgi:hypothetical protein
LQPPFRRGRWTALVAVSLALLASAASRADDFGLPPGDPEPATPAMTVTLPPGAVPPGAASAPAASAAIPPAAVVQPAPVPAAVAPAAVVPAEVVPPPAPAPAAPAEIADKSFNARTAALEDAVNDLSQKVQGTKFVLLQLSERILGTGMTSSGAKLAVWHRNELGSSYVITGIVYVLDGAPIYTKVDETGDLSSREEFVLFDSRVVPGPHQLAVQYDLRGHGYGVFSYLEELRLTLRKSLSFNIEPGKVTRIAGSAFEKGQITLEFKDRPDVNFEETVTKEVVRPLGEAGDKGADTVKTPGEDK